VLGLRHLLVALNAEKKLERITKVRFSICSSSSSSDTRVAYMQSVLFLSPAINGCDAWCSSSSTAVVAARQYCSSIVGLGASAPHLTILLNLLYGVCHVDNARGASGVL
jgi:hypothetical protein